MPDSHAEQLDPSVLGEQVGDDERAGDDFPPDEPLGVEDPSIVANGVVAPDDVASRDERLQPNEAEAASDEPAPSLIDPSGGDTPGLDDVERQLVADAGHGDAGPEAAAIHVIDER